MLFDFIKNHYELIGSIILVLISFILTLVKKKPSFNLMDSIKNYILEMLPIWIISVECTGKGSLKKDLVLNLIKEAIAKKFSFYNFSSIEEWCSNQVENILSTPSKKED